MHRIASALSWLVAGASLCLPAFAVAQALPSIEDRLRALEDELAATRGALGRAEEKLESVAPAPVAQGSAVDAFFTSLDVGGHVTASYVYNFNSPAVGQTTQTLCQFNCRHNEFKLDAAKLELGKEAANPGDAGFQLDLLLGQNADISRSLSPTAGGAGAFGEDDFSLFVQQAYVSYNWNGVELKAGNFETLLGWELIDSHSNYNISHGILFTWTIPLYHTGLMASGSIGERIGWNIGITNGFNNTIETNDDKGILGLVSFEDGPLFTSLSGYYGAESAERTASQPGSTDDLLILDFVASLEPSERLTLWLNADWGEQDDQDPAVGASGNSHYWGVAVGGNLALSDDLSLALRGEYFEDEDNIRGSDLTTGVVESLGVKLWSLTGTLKYALSQNLSLRGELRLDQADSDAVSGVEAAGDIFPDPDASDKNDHALYGLVEVAYVFD